MSRQVDKLIVGVAFEALENGGKSPFKLMLGAIAGLLLAPVVYLLVRQMASIGLARQCLAFSVFLLPAVGGIFAKVFFPFQAADPGFLDRLGKNWTTWTWMVVTIPLSVGCGIILGFSIAEAFQLKPNVPNPQISVGQLLATILSIVGVLFGAAWALFERQHRHPEDKDAVHEQNIRDGYV